MATIFRRTTREGKPAKHWSIKYKDARGQWRIVAGYASKELTKQKAHDLEERTLNIRAGRVDPFEKPKLCPLAEHLEAYRRYLANKGRSVDHIERTLGRVSAVFYGCGFQRLDPLAEFDATDKIARYLAERRAGDLSAHTSNHYLSAVKSFCRWAVKQGRMAASPITLMGSISTEQDDKRERRALSAKDFAKLITVARGGKKTHGLTGEDRAWLYLVAAYTGLRASELASLSAASFRLAERTVLVRAAYTKNREEARQPIGEDLARMLGGWLAGAGGKGALLWPGKWYRRAAEMLRVDLEAAGLPYSTHEGVADFHCLRVTYITNLARGGVHPSIAQKLARHSVVTLTMGVYTRLTGAEIAAGVKALPALPTIARTKRTKRPAARTKCAPNT